MRERRKSWAAACCLCQLGLRFGRCKKLTQICFQSPCIANPEPAKSRCWLPSAPRAVKSAPPATHPSERTRNGESKHCRLLAKFFPIGGRCGSPAAAQDSTAQGLKAWRRNERRLRHRQAWYSGVGLAEIQSVGKVIHVGAGVARSERCKPPTPLNQLQNGSVIEHERADS